MVSNSPSGVVSRLLASTPAGSLEARDSIGVPFGSTSFLASAYTSFKPAPRCPQKTDAPAPSITSSLIASRRVFMAHLPVPDSNSFTGKIRPTFKDGMKRR